VSFTADPFKNKQFVRTPQMIPTCNSIKLSAKECGLDVIWYRCFLEQTVVWATTACNIKRNEKFVKALERQL
jgi:hypothetical protein